MNSDKSLKGDNRQRILDTSLSLFAENGFKSTSMRDIAKGVGIKAPSIYNHFKSKDEIFEALIAESGPNKMIKKLQSVLADPDIENRIPSLVEGLLEIWGDANDNLLMKLILGESFRDHELSKRVFTSIFVQERSLLIQIFERLIQEQKIAPLSAEILADECLSKGLARRLELLLADDPETKLVSIRTGLHDQFQLFFRLLEIDFPREK